MSIEPGKIRNVAVVGHRGTGKTSLVEALLFQAEATNRLGSIDAGTTVTDWEEDEQRRQMSLSASLCASHLAGPQDQPDRHARRLGLPGRHGREPARRRRRARRRLRRDGRRGEHVARLVARGGARALARRVRQHARPRARRLLPRARLAAGAALRSLHRDPAADRRRARGLPASSTCSTTARTWIPSGGREGDPVAIPDRAGGDGRGVPHEAARRGRRDRRGADGALPRRRGDPGRRTSPPR